MESNVIKVGLCEGRHDIPDVSKFIFPSGVIGEMIKVTDARGLEMYARSSIERLVKHIDGVVHMELYVTGLTVALVAALNAANYLGDIKVTLRHYNIETKKYFHQEIYREGAK